ncbi:MAG TPA: tetratricopeptide repeat protein [Candidatus Sulfotelmatobacter sp.]|nr:tetratricopeptide repeat protein [Candidatus Sulfotelmatobacter sp.]
MKLVSLAVSGFFLVMLSVVPSRAQVSSETPPLTDDATTLMAADRSVSDRSLPGAAPMQAPQQVSTAAASPVEVKELTPEQMGDLYMARKQYVEAAQTFKVLSDKNPTNAVYLNKLGIALHQQEALALAMKYYERALKANPRYADAQNNIGTIWYQRKKFGKAIKAYEKAIKINDDMAVLYSNLGYAYFGDKKYEESIASFRIALQKDPQFFEHNSARSGSLLQDRSVTDRGRFYYLLAKSFAESGNIDRAVLYLRKAKDEGYATLVADLKKDKAAFAAEWKLPEVQNLINPQPMAETETEQN